MSEGSETAAAGTDPGPDPGPDRAPAQAHINAYWDLRSASYDGDPGHGILSAAEHTAWLDALRALLPPAPADVLDVGTGTGFLAFLLAELGHRVVGVDLSEGMLGLARERAAAQRATGLPAPEFREGDAIAPPLPAGSVDAVVSRHLLWTLTDPAGAFASWRRLLRPGGRVVAIDGLWHLRAPQAADAAPPPAAPADEAKARQRAAWDRHYSDAVQASLPLFAAGALDPVLAAVRAAGLGEARLTALPDVERIEAERSTRSATDRGPRIPRYVISATLEPSAAAGAPAGSDR